MSGWLSQTWEPNWRSFQYFNGYRLIVAVFLLFSFLLPFGWNLEQRNLLLHEHRHVALLAGAYALATGMGTLLALRWRQRFNMQLSLQVMVDVGAVVAMMYPLGGVASGIGILLLISLAAASLVGQGRLVLFYAALATLAMLVMQTIGVMQGLFDAATFIQAGLHSAAFFATAILARLLGERLMVQEDLARRRGIALANQRLVGSRIIERMQGGVMVVGRDGTVLQHNPGIESLVGIPNADGSPLAEHSPALAEAFARWQAGRLTGEVDFEGIDGKPLRGRFEATASSNGEALVFVEDVGRVRTQARQLKLASLGRLTASIAHEIRNPLAAISHAADLLHEERRGEMQDRLLRILRDNVFRLDRIVQDILQLGRSEAVQREVIDLDSFLAGFVEEFSGTKHVPQGTLVVEGGAGELCFDRSQLLQVLWNLVGNAVRHCRHQAGSVRLKVAPIAEGRVELHVMDDGEGIPEEHRELIFEPFFTTRHQGTGLGLFIARELCEANGASLQLVNNAGGHFVIIGESACQTAMSNAGRAAI